MNKILDLNKPIRRSFGILDLAAVDDDDAAVIEGHPAVYDQRTNIGGYFEEIIERGAFDDCDFTDVLLSVNHDLDKIPLARSRNNNANSTMQLGLDSTGLWMRAKLDRENNSEARSLHSAVQRGDINGMSFIFYVADDKWENLDSELPTRRIQKIRKVIEVSAVTFPAYAGTDISARDQATLDSVARALDSARSELDSLKRAKEQELEVERLRAQIRLKG